MSGSHTMTGRLSLGTCAQAIWDVKVGRTGLIHGVFPKGGKYLGATMKGKCLSPLW